jgi:hypothetical protein
MPKENKKLFDVKNAKEVNQEIGYLEDQLISIADRLSTTIKDAVSDIASEGKGVAEILGDQVVKSVKDLAKGLNETLKNTNKLNLGLLKTVDIEKQIADRQLQQQATIRNINTLVAKGVISKKEAEKAVAEINDAETAHNALLGDQLDLAKDIQKRMGLTGKIIQGISKIPLVGGLVDAAEATKAMQAAAAGGASQFKVMAVGLGAVGKSIGKSLTDPLALVTGYTGLFMKGIKAISGMIFGFMKDSAKIGQNFLNLAGSSSQVAKTIYSQVEGVHGLNINFKEATMHMQAINDLTGTAVVLSTEQQNQMQMLTNGLGLSEEKAAKLFKISQLTGTEFSDITASTDATVDLMNAQNGLALSTNDVLSKMTNITGQAKANLGNNPKALAEAAFQASKLGLELSEIQAAAENTLDFESSIEKEMKAELLLGKNLNLEALRKAALEGDTLTAGKEMEKIIKNNIGATKGNVLAQKALADTMGISVEKMFEINDEMKLQEKLGKGSSLTIEDYNKKRKEVQAQVLKDTGKRITLEEAGTRISKDDLKALNKKVEASQTFTRLLETAKETFISAFVNAPGAPIQKVIDGLSKFVKGGGLANAVDMIRKVGGVIGDFVADAVENPTEFVTKMALAFMLPLGALLLAQKMVPQLVIMGGAMLGKLGKAISKPLGKLGSKLSAKVVGKSIGGQFVKGGGRAAKGARAGGLLGKAGSMLGKAGSFMGGMFGGAVKGIKGAAKKVAGKFGGKAGAKLLGKSLLKKIPGIGLLAGVGFGLSRALKGDFAGAALELASGAASTIPGLGTAASIAIDAGLAARDMGAFKKGDKAESGDTAADFISRPGQPIQKFRKDDIIVGGTSLGGNGGGGNVEQLLRRILTAIEQGGDVIMDGDKVGKTLALATSRMG